MVDYKYVCLFAASWLTSFSVRADMNVAVIAPTDGDYKYYSEELINGAKVAVDTTEVKNIWKASGAKPGMVLYEVYTTVYITPRDGLAEQLKKK